MKTTKQDKKNPADNTGARKEKIAHSSQSTKKPSKVPKPLARKNTVENSGTAKKAIAAEKPDASARHAIIEGVNAECLGIRKKHIKTRNICKITFRLPGEAAFKAGTVTVVGDFNDWNREVTPLEKLENGDFEVTVEVDAGKEYRFRYLIDGQRWENDWHADKYVQSPYGVEDSVVCA